MNSRFVQENRLQAAFFFKLYGSDNQLILEKIEEHGAELRRIIEEYEAMHNRVPTVNDLLWIMSERRGKDIRG